ncbi:MAG: hypothetical protein HN487_09730 [Flavobacterium sp.]|jgi:hypothetical protein|nr:hypothetical protein [Flavobacterium sp.]
MKKIHFHNLGKKNYWILLIIFSLVFILVGIFEPFEFENEKTYKYISSFGFFLQAIYFSKLFWHKNTVQWNKKGATIRINSFMGRSLSFDQIRKTELIEKKLIVTKNDGKTVTFDLNEILESDTKKLNQIIIKNTIANTVYN